MASTKRTNRKATAKPVIDESASIAADQNEAAELVETTRAINEPTPAAEAPTLPAPPQAEEHTVIGAERGPVPDDIHNAPTLMVEAPSNLRSAAQEPTPPAVEPKPAFQTLAMPAPEAHPTPEERTARTQASLNQERSAMTGQRIATMIGLAAVFGVLIFLAYSLLGTRPAAETIVPATTSAPIPTAIPQPTAPPQPTVVPAAAVAPTAVSQPTAPPAPTAVSAAAAPTAVPAAAAPGVAATCNPIAGVPVFDGATCVEADSDVDDGVTKFENTYTAAASADELRRFYEGALGSNGWTLNEFNHAVTLQQRQLEISVDTDQGVNGTFTRVRLTERVPATAGAATTGVNCQAIDGLPVFPNATCVEGKPDVDDGIREIKNTYATSASPEEVRRFYETTLAQNGWASQESTFDLNQGLRRVQIDIETLPATAASNASSLKIAEK